MITPELNYRGLLMCPICTACFDVDADEDSDYDGACTDIQCPKCDRELVVDTVITYEVSVKLG